MLTRVVQSQLFGLTPHDPLTLGLATAALALAGYIPALRASRLDPRPPCVTSRPQQSVFSQP
jgi:hypothetical protein